MDFTANLSSKDKVPTKTPFNKDDKDSYNSTYTTNVYDSQGGKHTMTQYFVKTGDNQWEAHYFMDDKPMTPAYKALSFDQNGKLTTPDKPFPLSSNGIGGGVNELSISMNYGATTQFGNDFSVSQNKATGYAAGEKTGQQVDEDGKVYATYSNGERMLQGQLVLANFMNPDGLAAQNGTTWVQTANSGAPIIGAPGTGLMGKIQSGTLENSTVDMTAELVNLMTSQRNYQANTKVISTNDQMTSALFQAI
ncbi:MAG: flagellar hook-basal body complex protein [Enterobacteriaceae bacterium]